MLEAFDAVDGAALEHGCGGASAVPDVLLARPFAEPALPLYALAPRDAASTRATLRRSLGGR